MHEKSHRKTLILGERAIAEMIGKQLEEEGFHPVFLSSLNIKNFQLPMLADPNSIHQMRELLAQFAFLSEGQGAVHPATTSWAERPELPLLAQELGLVAICPSARILSLFGNKLNFLIEVERIGVPNLVQSLVPMHSLREIEQFLQSKKLNSSIVLRAIKGGGASSFCVIQDPEDLRKQVPLWIEKLRHYYGEVLFFIERRLEGARQIGIPFARTQDGRFQCFPSVDSSLQCRHRKVVEFCPADEVDSSVHRQLISWAEKLAKHWGYVGVGEFEFLVDGNRAFLVDGLGRLNTNFHLWGQVAGTNAVSWQIAALESYNLRHLPPIRDSKQWAHGVSLRIYAEDSLFHLPQPGKVQGISREQGWKSNGAQAELRLNYEEGQDVSIFDSGLLGILVGISASRDKLLPLMQEVLKEIWIHGTLQTNERFLLELISHPWVQEEVFHIGFIDEEFVPSLRPPQELISIAVALASSHPGLQPDLQPNLQNDPKLYRWKVEGQWIEPGKLDWIQPPHDLINDSGEVRLRDGSMIRVHVHKKEGGQWRVRLGFWYVTVWQVEALTQFSLDRKKIRILSASLPGRIHSLFFRSGAVVPAHEPLLVIESLGILIPHSLSVPSRVTEWFIKTEDRVDVGQALAEFERLC